jgi:hypothetical protein
LNVSVKRIGKQKAATIEASKKKLVKTITAILYAQTPETSFAEVGKALRTRKREIHRRVAAEIPRTAPDKYRNFVNQIAENAAKQAIEDAEFMAAWSVKNWSNAGSRFHKFAQDEGEKLSLEFEFPKTEMQFEFEAAGGKSRLDVLIIEREPRLMLYEFDYKTHSKSALGEADEMKQHFRDIRKEFKQIAVEQMTQESVSWKGAVERALRAREDQ